MGKNKAIISKFGDELIQNGPLQSLLTTSICKKGVASLAKPDVTQVHSLLYQRAAGHPSHASDVRYISVQVICSLSNVLDTLRDEAMLPPACQAAIVAMLQCVNAGLLKALMQDSGAGSAAILQRVQVCSELTASHKVT